MGAGSKTDLNEHSSGTETRQGWVQREIETFSFEPEGFVFCAKDTGGEAFGQKQGILTAPKDWLSCIGNPQ